jgi:uncharacterized protein (DUF736 family)
MATQPGNNPNPWDNKEVGAAWKKKSKKGESYLSLRIDIEKLKANGFTKDAQLIGFSNKNKQKDSHPDIRIYVSERQENTGAAPAKTAAATRPAAVPAPTPVAASAEENELI